MAGWVQLLFLIKYRFEGADDNAGASPSAITSRLLSSVLVGSNGTAFLLEDGSSDRFTRYRIFSCDWLEQQFKSCLSYF